MFALLRASLNGHWKQFCLELSHPKASGASQQPLAIQNQQVAAVTATRTR